MAELILLQPHVGDMDSLRSKPSLPLALLHASSLVAREFETVLIDRRIDADWKTTLRKAIDSKTLAIGFTAFTGPMINSCLEMADEARSIAKLPHIWGGVHSSLEPGTTIADDRVDIVVIGEGEETLLDIMRALKKKTPLSEIPGIWHKENGEPKQTPSRPQLDVELLPEIPYDLVDVQNYLPLYMNRKSLFFQGSRGCPHNCGYCYNVKFNHRSFRKQSAEKVLNRIRFAVEKFGAEDIYFLDDNFFVDKKRDLALIDGMEEIGVTWQIQGVDVMAIKRMDDAVLKKIEKSGLSRLTIGIETGSPRIRKLIQKGGTVEEIETAIGRLANYDLNVFASFMLGFPTETIDEMKQTIALLLRLLELNPKMHNSPLYNYKAYPGTPMAELAVQQGYKPPTNLAEWGKSGGWDYCIWRDKADFKMFENLFFVSNFLDRKMETYGVPWPVRKIADIYRPIAKWRVRNLNFDLLVEKFFADIAKSMMEKRISQSARASG